MPPPKKKPAPMTFPLSKLEELRLEMALGHEKTRPTPKPAPSHSRPEPEATIGAARIGDRYQPPSLSLSSLMTSENPLQDLAENFLGEARPPSVYNMDPIGEQAWAIGAGQMPMIAGTTEAVGGIKAYHGSPHNFDKFSTEKIGTGEGAQAYGHGLYFAENPSVAADYRKRLSPNDLKVEYQGRPLQRGDVRSGALIQVDHVGKDKAIEQAEKWLAHLNTSEGVLPSVVADQKRLVDWLKNLDLEQVKVDRPGKMYEVQINAQPDQFLDWDKPLSEQPPPVKEALATHGVKPVDPALIREAEEQLADYWKEYEAALRKGDKGRIDIFERSIKQSEHDLRRLQKASQMSGAEAYRELGQRGESVASQRLREAGIPGIKYLDAGSRSAGQGSRNYVVFDDSLVSILKKYGIALPVIEGLRRQAQANGGVVPSSDVHGLIQQQ